MMNCTKCGQTIMLGSGCGCPREKTLHEKEAEERTYKRMIAQIQNMADSAGFLEAQRRAQTRYLDYDGIRGAFDSLEIGIDYDDAFRYVEGGGLLTVLPGEFHGIVFGNILGFALIVAELIEHGMTAQLREAIQMVEDAECQADRDDAWLNLRSFLIARDQPRSPLPEQAPRPQQGVSHKNQSQEPA